MMSATLLANGFFFWVIQLAGHFLLVLHEPVYFEEIETFFSKSFGDIIIEVFYEISNSLIQQTWAIAMCWTLC